MHQVRNYKIPQVPWLMSSHSSQSCREQYYVPRQDAQPIVPIIQLSVHNVQKEDRQLKHSQASVQDQSENFEQDQKEALGDVVEESFSVNMVEVSNNGNKKNHIDLSSDEQQNNRSHKIESVEQNSSSDQQPNGQSRKDES